MQIMRETERSLRQNNLDLVDIQISYQFLSSHPTFRGQHDHCCWTPCIPRKRAAAGQSVWPFAKGALQIAHLCMVEPRKDFTYRASLHLFFLPLMYPSARFRASSFFSSFRVCPLHRVTYIIFLYMQCIRCIHCYIIIKSEMTSMKGMDLSRIPIFAHTQY